MILKTISTVPFQYTFFFFFRNGTRGADNARIRKICSLAVYEYVNRQSKVVWTFLNVIKHFIS